MPSSRYLLTASHAARDAFARTMDSRLEGGRAACGWPTASRPASFRVLAWSDLCPDSTDQAIVLARVLPWNGEEWRRMARRIAGALRPGGEAYVVLTGPPRAQLAPSFRSTLIDAGLVIAEHGAFGGPFSALEEALVQATANTASRAGKAALASSRWLVRGLRPLDRWLAARADERFAPDLFARLLRPRIEGRKLHVGAGRERLEGWVNLDRQPLPSVDVVADASLHVVATTGSMDVVFAEHFLEHLPLDGAVDFLQEAHRVLRPGGTLRLTTPSLLWVLSTHGRADADVPVSRAIDSTLAWNLAFHGWEHRFLWSRAWLAEVLTACGFVDLRWPDWGESTEPALCGLERHQRYRDVEEASHVLIVEARAAAAKADELAALRERIARQVLDHGRG